MVIISQRQALIFASAFGVRQTANSTFQIVFGGLMSGHPVHLDWNDKPAFVIAKREENHPPSIY